MSSPQSKPATDIENHSKVHHATGLYLGEAGDRDACGLVGGVSEPDGARFAGGFGDWCGTAHGGDLFGVLAAFEQRSDLCDQRGEADGGHSGHVFSRAVLGWTANASAMSRSRWLISAFSSLI